MTGPDKHIKFRLENYDSLCFLKNIIKNPNIIVGDYTYYNNFEDVENFERNIKYHFEFSGDKLIIGKFCMLASGVKFIMNGVAIFGNGWEQAMEGKAYPFKGNTVIVNDVWIGHKATIMAGVNIGAGAIIATNATVVKDVAPYSIVGENPAAEIKKRFHEATIKKLLELKWWDWDIEKITRNVQHLTANQIDKLVP